jgi:hypothetical protein
MAVREREIGRLIEREN